MNDLNGIGWLSLGRIVSVSKVRADLCGLDDGLYGLNGAGYGLFGIGVIRRSGLGSKSGSSGSSVLVSNRNDFLLERRGTLVVCFMRAWYLYVGNNMFFF